MKKNYTIFIKLFFLFRPGGETGIHSGLKILRSQDHAGSTPAPGKCLTKAFGNAKFKITSKLFILKLVFIFLSKESC